MILTKRQESLLKRLLDDPDWQDLLDQIEVDSAIKPWRPSGKLSEEEKKSQWVYESGIKKHASDILTIFRMNT